MILISLVIVSTLFGIYYVLSGLEAGTALLYLFRKKGSLKTEPSLALFTPLWEATNVFLVFGFTGFSVLFNNSLVPLSPKILSTLTAGLVALIVRACSVIYIFYFRSPKKRSAFGGLLFLLSSFVVPLSFAAPGIYLLTGATFWQTPAGWALSLALLLSLLSLATNFMRNRLGNEAGAVVRHIARALTALFCVVTSIGLQLSVNHAQTHLLSWPYELFIISIAFIALVQLLLWLIRKEALTLWYVSLVGLLSPLLLSLANRPYLVFPKITLEQAYGASSFSSAILIGLAVIFTVVAFGTVLFIWLLRHPAPQDNPVIR